MSSSRYKSILPTAAQDAEREMEAAFQSDTDDDSHSVHESTPLTHGENTRAAPGGFQGTPGTVSTIPGSYDFERDYEYDYPPPGSPPRPSSRALPNDYGNNNGVLPSSPIKPSMPRPSVVRRIVGAILPTHYVRVPSESSTARVVGGGTDNDGVFANVMAKPSVGRVVHTGNGGVYVMPEEIQNEVPPTYADAQADAVPPYWETTVHAPASLDPAGDMIVEDLPTGSILIFAINAFISFFFQFVGFLLTYLLHTSHAAKYGSRFGLGLTLIQFGFYSRAINTESGNAAAADPIASEIWDVSFNTTVSVTNVTSTATTAPMPDDNIFPISSRDLISFFFMTLGWFLILSSGIGFWKVKRWESALRNPPAPLTVEDIERDRAIRRNIESVFGISFGEEESHPEDTPLGQAEANLTRDLRAAGLI